jgi:hypothetical protein
MPLEFPQHSQHHVSSILKSPHMQEKKVKITTHLMCGPLPLLCRAKGMSKQQPLYLSLPQAVTFGAGKRFYKVLL